MSKAKTKLKEQEAVEVAQTKYTGEPSDKVKAAAAAAQQETNEPKHFVYELREHCRELFGVAPEVFDGALFNCKELQITKLEAEQRITNYLNRKLDEGVRT